MYGYVDRKHIQEDIEKPQSLPREIVSKDGFKTIGIPFTNKEGLLQNFVCLFKIDLTLT